MNIKTLGIDLAKNVFQMHGVDAQGKVVLRKRLSRSDLASFVLNLPPCLIGMESCGGANYWARKFQSYGHEVKIMNPQFVKPYVKSNKNDRNDSEAICEAVTRPNMRFVSVKKIAQQDMQMLHRIRSQLVANRTAVANQIRGLLSEYGIVFPMQIQNVRKELPQVIDDTNNELSEFARGLFRELQEDLVTLDKRIDACEAKIKALFKSNEQCQRISEIEGIGMITATALVSAIGDPKTFKDGRELSAWLGLVPKQASSGGKTLLLGISKRGDRYLRALLIHGARSVVCRASNKKDKRSQWINDIRYRGGMNKACVALANKNARIVWALLAHNAEYRKAA